MVDLPQHVNLSLFISSLCFGIVGLYYFILFLPHVNTILNNPFMFIHHEILISFLHSGVFLLEVLLILLTNGFALPLGLILGVAGIASFFIEPSSDVIILFFNLFMPLLALITLIMGHKGLSSEYIDTF
ncbi:hypothetical protein J7J90_04335 [Candidatus Micrarchaeota archaeon]|nr:hypothetical protein [Candidatus Micrarchaeota archaeon]